jgi:hypothetical protein
MVAALVQLPAVVYFLMGVKDPELLCCRFQKIFQGKCAGFYQHEHTE